MGVSINKIDGKELIECLPDFFGVPSDCVTLTIIADVQTRPYIMATRINNKGEEVLLVFSYKGSELSVRDQNIQLTKALETVICMPEDCISFKIDSQEDEAVIIDSKCLLRYKDGSI